MAPHFFVDDMTIKSIEVAQQAYLLTDMRNTLARFHQDVDCAFWQCDDVWLSVAFRSFNIEAECAQITCPALAIQSNADPYDSKALIDTSALSNMRKQLLKLEQFGHSPHKDQILKVLQAVADFLGAAYGLSDLQCSIICSNRTLRPRQYVTHKAKNTKLSRLKSVPHPP